MKKLFSIFIFIFLLSTYSKAQEGYRLEFEIKGLENADMVLAFYYGDMTYTKGSAKADGNGKVVFEGDEPLDKGIYILVLDSVKRKLFDFVVYTDQNFKISSDMENLYRGMQVEGDKDNEIYLKHLFFNADQAEKAEPYTQILQDSSSTDEEIRAAREQLRKINEDVVDYQLNLINEYPETLIGKIVKARREPTGSKDPAYKTDTTYQYYYFKQHYWDNIDLDEDALLRLPVNLISDKINQYFDQILVQDPDTLIYEIDRVLGLAKSNQEVYKFFTWSLTSKFFNPKIMGLDKVLVHISDKYFSSGEMDFWANEQLKENVIERASQLRLSMIGNKAPNLVMQDISKQPKSLYEIKNKYTVIYFYDPDCGHCKVETPKLVDFVKETQFDVQVYSVCADTSLVKMEKYITEMGLEKWVNVNGPRSYVGSYQDLYDAFQTPTIYILNEKKEIIAKKLPADQLEDFLTRYSAIRRED